MGKAAIFMNCKHNNCTGTLVRTIADEPYNPAYYICELCDSTYTIWEFMKKAYALSHREFCASMEVAKVDDSNVESRDKTALIEIMGQHDLLYHPWYFKQDHPNVMRIMFDDVDTIIHVPEFHRLADGRDDRYAYPMTKEQGQLIVDFVKRNDKVGNFIVHCAAGISRSGAVAKFITEYFGGEDKDYYAINPYTKPNQRILSILRNLVQ